MAILAVVCFYIAIWLPAASFYEGQEAFAATLGLVPQIVLASLAGYLVGQLLNAWIMHAMKKRSGEGGLKTRLIASTVVGEDRKSTRLNSSHVAISYAVFCLKKKTKPEDIQV